MTDQHFIPLERTTQFDKTSMLQNLLATDSLSLVHQSASK